jgi:hypothetical protein
VVWALVGFSDILAAFNERSLRMQAFEPIAHVHIGINGRWGFRMHGARRYLRRFDTRSEAVRYGRAVAKRKGLLLVIHTTDGEVHSEIKPPKIRPKK